MAKRASLLLVFLAAIFTLVGGIWGSASARVDPEGLVAHEWGTFTTVAGRDGLAVEWLPLGGPSDLPCFVNRFSDVGLFKGPLSTVSQTRLTYAGARANLWGKVRMETPVVYFYSPKNVSVDVTVRFPRGIITEWYPHAILAQPNVNQSVLRSPSHVSLIQWRNVQVLPKANAAYLTEPGESHYYAARETDAAPINVNNQLEKFLFYRGVAAFDVPIASEALDNGSVRVKNLGSRDLRGVILFQNRAGRLSYRVHGTLRGEATLAEPTESANPDVVRAELERILTHAGLYPKEAKAMVATWRDSWFEEGTRVFYVLAPRDVDEILPLTIQPAASQVARVFVGRMEVITPSALRTIAKAIDARDTATLERHGRFLGAMADRLLANGVRDEQQGRIADLTNAALATYARSFASCKGRS
jgi:hypothetical protein